MQYGNVARNTGAQRRPELRYDAGKDGFIDLMELKLMMEKLGAPQTHLGLKNMIKEVDEDLDNKLSFRELPPAAHQGECFNSALVLEGIFIGFLL
ncbi:PREDICTED: EF-hand domain-containing protein D2-like [Pygoscelis adeliae]|uniref:EF-hand domain-containing protein D2-like n=1 Tax=Pygoscelis adeliae TaxID=9238 RepID=UPI0004F4D73D|nr:PREDICTED: EF-hand domain-containing protein D2-like [Pygoscelis adeliae]